MATDLITDDRRSTPVLPGLGRPAGRGVRNETPLIAAFWLLTVAAFVALLAVDPQWGSAPVGPRDPDSMLRAENARRALATVDERAPGGRISMLRLQPDSARIFVDGAPNGTSMLIVEAGGDVDAFGAGTGHPGTGGLRPSAVDVAAPMRLLDALRARRRSDRHDYMLLMGAGAGRWTVFVDGRQALVAGPDGRVQGKRRSKDRRAGAPVPPTAAQLRRRQRRFQRCIQRSVRRGTDVGACTAILHGGAR